MEDGGGGTGPSVSRAPGLGCKEGWGEDDGMLGCGGVQGVERFAVWVLQDGRIAESVQVRCSQASAGWRCFAAWPPVAP